MNATTTVCTITDPTFEPGCAVLLNSLITAGFDGRVVIGLVGDGHRLPDLVSPKNIGGLEIVFQKLQPVYNINAHKPGLMAWCLEDTSQKAVFFFDADIVICRDWRHFNDWVENGIAVCSDVSLLWMPPNHPKRALYRSVIRTLGLSEANVTGYANGGFLGLKRDSAHVLTIWQKVLDWLDNHAALSWDTWSINAGFEKYDQDALNVALMAAPGHVSFVGHEGMSFGSSVGYMVHPVGARKPWNKGFLRDLLVHGRALPLAARQFWMYADGPVRLFNRREMLLAQVEMNITSALSRVIAR